MSRVTDEVRDHSFDGIEEYDNPLPRWWLGIFYVTAAFAVFYMPWVHFVEGNTIIDEYAVEMEEGKKLVAANRIEWVQEDLEAHCQTDAWQAGAEAEFAAKCVACHRQDGGGLVGPSFADDFYIHGGRHIDLARTIEKGVPEKGMVAWGKILKPEQIKDLVCKVKAFRGTEVKDPKPPQGKKVDAQGRPLG